MARRGYVKGKSNLYRRAMMKAKVKSNLARRARANKRVATVGLVKRLINKNVENKLHGTAYNRQFPPVVTTTSCYGLLPPISQGTTDNARIGNRINPRGLLVNLTVYPTDDATIPPGTVFLPRIMVVSQKATSGYQPNATPDVGNLLDYGGGEHTFSGNMWDYTAPINTDHFVVHKDIKTKITLGNGDENPHLCKTFKFWVPCPKTLTYDDGQQYPQNFAPNLIVGWANGREYPFTDTYVSCSWTTTLYYEDA